MERIYVDDMLVETVETRILKWRYGVASKKLALKKANDDARNLVDNLVNWGVIDSVSPNRTLYIFDRQFVIDYNGRLVRCVDFNETGDKFIRSLSLAMTLAEVSRTSSQYKRELQGNGPFGYGYYTLLEGQVISYSRMVGELPGDVPERLPETVVAIEDKLYCVNGPYILARFGLWDIGL